ncbi:MAG: hypothetical protein QNJ31_09460 [Candidatus Caenarcaniphilales bacterium]|nr:hypothetical protein [Candidatus Caenarcaniphilales bacterium]
MFSSNNDFARIHLDNLLKIRAEVNITTGLTNKIKDKIINFLSALEYKGNYSADEYITRAEFNKFIEENPNFLSFKDGSNDWVLDNYFDKYGESATSSLYTDRSGKNFFYEKIDEGQLIPVWIKLDGRQREKLKEVRDFGLKLYLPRLVATHNKGDILSRELDLAYSRLLALKESKETGLPITIVYDDFFNHSHNRRFSGLIPHGVPVSTPIENLGSLAYRIDSNYIRLSRYIPEIKMLREKGYPVSTLNLSMSIGSKNNEYLSIKNIKEFMLSRYSNNKELIKKIKSINNDGSNLKKFREILDEYFWRDDSIKAFFKETSTQIVSNFLDDFDSINQLENDGINVSIGAGNVEAQGDNHSLNLLTVAPNVNVAGALNPETGKPFKHTYTDNSLVTDYRSPFLQLSYIYDLDKGFSVDLGKNGTIDYSLSPAKTKELMSKSNRKFIDGSLKLALMNSKEEKRFKHLYDRIAEEMNNQRNAFTQIQPEDLTPKVLYKILSSVKNEIEELRSICSEHVFFTYSFSKFFNDYPKNGKFIPKISKSSFLHFLFNKDLSRSDIYIHFPDEDSSSNDDALQKFDLSDVTQILSKDDGTIFAYSGEARLNGTSLSTPKVSAEIAQGLLEAK